MKASKDSLGTRMKENYENRTRYLLPRRTNIIIRIDGKAFHSYTKGLDRPIDQGLTDDMNETTKYLCENIQGAKFGYVQSDEISILITDYEDITTDGWFDNNLQKMCSISASMATAKFNELRLKRNLKIMEDLRRPDELFLNWDRQKLATFDSRVFVIPETEEVINYFIWRQQDATRNSVSMAAQSMFSHKELHDKSSSQMQDMMMTKNVNWNDYPIGFKRGRCVIKKSDILEKLEEVKRQKNAFVKIQEWENAAMMRVKEKELLSTIDTMTVRKKWTIVDPPIFTQDRGFITFKNSKEDEYVTKCIHN